MSRVPGRGGRRLERRVGGQGGCGEGEVQTAAVERVVVTCPRLGIASGVSAVVGAVLPHLRRYVRRLDVLEVGSERGGVGPGRDQARVWRQLRERDVDVLMVNPSLGWKSVIRDGLFVLQARKQGVAVAVMVHGWRERLWGRRWVRWWCRHVLFGGAGRIWVLSKTIRDEVARCCPRVDVRLAWTVVGQDVLEAERTRGGRKWEGEVVRLTYLGRLVERKGLPQLLEAVENLSGGGDGRRWQLSIAGDGPLREVLERMVAERRLEEQVRFLGFVAGEKKTRLLRESDAVVLLSESEGLPVSVLEGMYMGAIPVVTGVGALPEHIDDERNGIIVSSSDAAEVARRLTGLFADRGRVERMRREAMRDAEKYRPETLARLIGCGVAEVSRRRRYGPGNTRGLVV